MRRLSADHFRFAVKATLLGAFTTLTFLVFEWLVNHGTQFIWNDLFHTNEFRWGVVPLAIVLSIAFTALVRAFGQRRMIKPHVDLLAGDEEVRRTTLGSIGTIFIIGLASLLAGASLGPEMSLMALSSSLGVWIATRRGRSDHPRLLALAAVGALLVAFLGSLFPIIIPLLLIRKQRGRLGLSTAIPIVLAGVAAYLALVAIQGHSEGYGSIPVGQTFHGKDFITAVLLGLVGTLAALVLKRTITVLSGVARWIDHHGHWTVTAMVFGAGLGALYLAGGESVQFSGSQGVHQLTAAAAAYGTLGFIALALVKILATAWSEATGYRGGLVFPSVYIGTAISLAAGAVALPLAGPGAMIGTIGGIMAAMTSPALAAVLLIALLPVKMTGLALAGILGAVVGNRLVRRLNPSEPTASET